MCDDFYLFTYSFRLPSDFGGKQTQTDSCLTWSYFSLFFSPLCLGHAQGSGWLIEMSREVSQTSTWATSNIVISTPNPSKRHKGVQRDGREWLNSKPLSLQSVSCLPVLPIRSAVISQSFNTVIRLVFFIILFVKRVTICTCLGTDESIHSAGHSFASLFCLLLLAVLLPLFLFTMTVCSRVHYPQLSQRKSVTLISSSFFDSKGCSQSHWKINSQFQRWVSF